MSAATTAEPLLLDSALPDFRFARLECTPVASAPSAAYQAARDLDLLSVGSPLFNLVTWARWLPDRLRGRPSRGPASMRLADLLDRTMEDAQEQPWVALGEEAGREMVFGAVGKVWQPSIEWWPIEHGEFPAFAEPGWAKIAAALVVHPYGARRCLLTYEARTACTDQRSAARFGRYWEFVSPGVGVVMRGSLQAIRTAAEGGLRTAQRSHAFDPRL